MSAAGTPVVELALFPIAAILLLLSGAGAPAHLADGTGSPAALLRRFLIQGPGRAAVDQRRQAPVAYQAPCAQPAAAAQHASSLLDTQVRLVAQRASTPTFRTRFGVRSGAYLGTAPPRS